MLLQKSSFLLLEPLGCRQVVIFGRCLISLQDSLLEECDSLITLDANSNGLIVLVKIHTTTSASATGHAEVNQKSLRYNTVLDRYVSLGLVWILDLCWMAFHHISATLYQVNNRYIQNVIAICVT